MARVAFDGVVEVGGTLGPSFEASAVDVSEEGMHLRSAYLPELGQQITCRFEAGPNRSVVGSGEVVWSQGADKGGEFGIRFTEMDAECVEALKRVCGMQSDAGPAPVPAGGKVRLFIEGLASPMRAKIRESQSGALTVGSDLGFLQVGKRLDLENAQTGDKRPATIDRVDIDVDPNSRVPQLVVTLRYVDGAPVMAGASMPRDVSPSGGDAHADDSSARMRGAFAEQAARLGPAVDRAMRRMKTTVGLLAKGRVGDDDPMPRRTTAPAPGGGLRADGRRVVRGESAFATDGGVPPGAQAKAGHFGRRRVAIGAAVMATAVLGAFAMKHSHQDPSAVVAPAPGASETSPGAAAAPPAAPEQPAPAAPPLGQVATSPPAPPGTTAPQTVANAGAGEDKDKSGASTSGTEDGAKKHARPQPFANGPVHHGNILRLKMDGPVEAIEGAQEPTGFLVKVPGRRSLEPASPLAARDGRIQTIKVTNGASGAELSITFKDSVPNYRVSARGDSLVIALAPIGSLQDTTVADSAVGKRTSRGGKSSGHTGHTSTPAGVER
ncbi:MAG TPA: PilZ domain-containing protein [Polyangiaceae bacterium]